MRAARSTPRSSRNANVGSQADRPGESSIHDSTPDFDYTATHGGLAETVCLAALASAERINARHGRFIIRHARDRFSGCQSLDEIRSAYGSDDLVVTDRGHSLDTITTSRVIASDAGCPWSWMNRLTFSSSDSLMRGCLLLKRRATGIRRESGVLHHIEVARYEQVSVHDGTQGDDVPGQDTDLWETTVASAAQPCS